MSFESTSLSLQPIEHFADLNQFTGKIVVFSQEEPGGVAAWGAHKISRGMGLVESEIDPPYVGHPRETKFVVTIFASPTEMASRKAGYDSFRITERSFQRGKRLWMRLGTDSEVQSIRKTIASEIDAAGPKALFEINDMIRQIRQRQLSPSQV